MNAINIIVLIIGSILIALLISAVDNVAYDEKNDNDNNNNK